MAANPLVSVVMPAYNAAAHIVEAIASIQRQSYPRFELIVVDNGSSDATATIVEEIAARDSRVRLVDEAQRGISPAANAGVEAARGDFIARMDADDIALPERFAQQLQLFAADSMVGVCGTAARQFDGANRTMPVLSDHRAIRTQMLFATPFVNPTVMMRRVLVARIGVPLYMYGLDPAEDYDLWMRCVHATRFANVPRVLLHYRVHAAQSSMSQRERQRRAHMRVARRVWDDVGLHAVPDETIRSLVWPKEYPAPAACALHALSAALGAAARAGMSRGVTGRYFGRWAMSAPWRARARPSNVAAGR